VPSLDGKRVLITGASSGIGAAVAEAFAREGAEVALVARTRDALLTVAARASAHGRPAHVVVADLGDRGAAERAVAEAVAALGGLDVLVSNAAAMEFARFGESRPEAFERTIAVTFLGAVAVVRAALPHLERTGGTIVAVGSITARVPLPAFASYAAAKHALRGFLGSLRIELLEAGSPVRVAMVHPGLVDTPLWHTLTSASGRSPRLLPTAYAPGEIARALVGMAVRPRAELTLGLEARALELLFAAARPVADRVLALLARWHRGGRRFAPTPGALWAPSGTGEAAGGLHGRPSLWVRLRA